MSIEVVEKLSISLAMVACLCFVITCVLKWILEWILRRARKADQKFMDELMEARRKRGFTGD